MRNNKERESVNKQSRKKEQESVSEEYRFVIMRPGGNDTWLYYGVVEDQVKRKKLNDLIMATYSNVEQVGFIDLNPVGPTLMMAGGEFCGNATRSTAWLALGGKPGEISIQVSGVRGKLRAGVTQDGEAFAQMPIYENPQRIKPISDGYIIEMEGITHFVTSAPDGLKSLSEDKVKQMGRLKMNEVGIANSPAAGVMYVLNNADTIEVVPIVYVPKADTLYYETACGSGTTAMGLLQAIRKGTSVDIPIMQPSGMPIRISVDYDGKSFQYAQIQGPIEKLASGTIEINTGSVIEDITSETQLKQALGKEGLIDLYKSVFRGPPYYEEFTDEEVINEFDNYLVNGFVSIFRKDGKIVGFEGTCRASSSSVADIVEKIGINPQITWYFGDLGVDIFYRRQGIGKKLTARRLASLTDPVILRTSKDNFQAISLYQSLGFQILEGMKQSVEQTRVGRIIEKDERIFLLKEGVKYEE